MKLFKHRTLIAAALATAFVGLSATAVAQGMGAGAMSEELRAQHMAQRMATEQAGQGKMAQKQAQRMERMQQRMAERQTQLKASLQITPAQEAAWSDFVARTAPQPFKARDARREGGSQLTTPERLDQMQARQAERNAAMAQRIDATRSFYAALTPEQQKVFDTQRHGGFQRTNMKGEHGMKGQHGKGSHHRMGGESGTGCGAMMQPRT